MKVCFFLTNPFSQDTRIIKQCSALRKLGFDVVVVAYKRPGFKDEETMPDGTRIVRAHGTWKYAVWAISGCLQERLKRTFPNAVWSILDRAWPVKRRAVAKLKAVFGVFFGRHIRGPLEEVPQQIRDAKMTELAFTSFQKVELALLLLFSPFLVVLGMVAMLVGVLIAMFRKIIQSGRVRAILSGDIRFLRVLLLTRNFLAFAAHGIRVNADIYQANDPETLFVAWCCAKFGRGRLVYDSHELYDESFPVRKRLPVRFTIRLLEGVFARRADAVFTVNASTAEILQRRYGLKERPVAVRNVQPYQERMATVPSLLRDAIGDVDDERVLFVYAGRITRGRGLEQTVAAMAQAGPRATLVMIGTVDPVMGRKLQVLIDRHQLADRVAMIPPVPSETLAGILGAADVGLMLTETVALSYYYGLGNKLFHYVQAGLPVIVPNHPEKRRIVEGYDVGWWIDRVTPKAIAEIIGQIVANTEELERKKENCHVAAKELCWEREKERYEKVYIDMYELELYRNDVYGGLFSWRP